MRTAVLYSGGKDSNYALYWAINQGWEIKHLVALKPRDRDSYMFHFPCVDLTELQAESIGIPLIKKEVSGAKEREVLELQDVLKNLEIDGIVSGAVASEYQKTRLDTVADNLNIKSFSPLWHKSPERLMEDMVSAGFEIMVVGVSAHGLGEEWIGRTIDEKCLADLKLLSKKHGIHLAGEGGEYETIVINAPIFAKRVKILKSRKTWDKQAGFLTIEKAALD